MKGEKKSPLIGAGLRVGRKNLQIAYGARLWRVSLHDPRGVSGVG